MVVIDEVHEEEEVKSERIEETAVGSDNEPDDNATNSKKMKLPAAAAKQAAPPPPPAPEIKLSQIVPMVAMLAMQKFDLEKLGYVRYVEIGYIIVQLLSFAVLYVIYCRINDMKDDGVKIQIPEVKQLGQVVAPAKVQTRKEYDLDQWNDAVKQPLIGFVILGGIYYKWGSLSVLVLQLLMTPMTVYEAPLTQIHILGKEKSRPFPKPNPFGLPEMPEMPAAQAEVSDHATSSKAEVKKDK